MTGAKPINGLYGAWEYPNASQGKPVNNVPLSHSASTHIAATVSAQANDEVIFIRLSSQLPVVKNKAR